MTGKLAEHWDAVYAGKAEIETSWYEDEPTTSLDLIDHFATPGGAATDIGAGRSRLPVLLLQRGWRPVFAVDVSAAALDQLAARDGHPDGLVCVASNVLAWQPDQPVTLWHDRAVFHFLTADEDQAAYAALAATTVQPGGALVIGTFAPSGPEQCSGLTVARHDVASLQRIFGPRFAVVADRVVEHRTPWAAAQPFTWAVFTRLAD